MKPCVGCTKRHLKCHSECEEYKNYYTKQEHPVFLESETHKKRRKPFDEELVMKLYKEGKNDVQIAEEMGISQWAVAKWRYSKGLESNFFTKNRRRISQIDIDAAAAHKLGLTYGEYKRREAFGNV